METDVKEVVIIDQDEEFCQKFETELNQTEDFACAATATDGHEGLQLIFREDPDYVLMDLILPYLDGVSVLDELREEEKIEDVNIIVLSSFLNDQMLKILQNYEIDYFMSKPADFDCIKNRITDLDQDYTLSNYESSLAEQLNSDENEVNMNLEITGLLDEFGVPANIRGYMYLRNAIYLSITDLELVNSITKQLYPKIAENFSTVASRVERAIRHAIKVAWERGNRDKISEYFGYSISETIGRPTNAQFIAKVADDFRLRNRLITN
ncbi:MAG TPA: sporulation transcription factor Spo0A [Halanaerobiales bacterium]|nr:sporulation transcription factor Spo0A [Halanaerobiales bacterium]